MSENELNDRVVLAGFLAVLIISGEAEQNFLTRHLAQLDTEGQRAFHVAWEQGAQLARQYIAEGTAK